MKQYGLYLNFDMEYILKLTTICVIVSFFSLLIKKSQPELSLVLGTCSVIFCVFSIVEIYRQIHIQFEQWQKTALIASEYFVPLFKCLGISVVSHLGVGICKDAGQTAAASCLEFCANVAAVWCIIPLINHLFTIIEELI